jgi:hypothetical protein
MGTVIPIGIVFLLINITTINQLFAKTPQWYQNTKFTSNKQIYYGHGSSVTISAARDLALLEISQQLQVNIASTSEYKTQQKNNKFFKKQQTSLVTSSVTNLKDVKQIKSTCIEDICYVVMKYHYTTPFWFANRIVEAPLFSKIGYGSGESPSIATKQATQDLQSQLEIHNVQDIQTIRSEKVGDTYFMARFFQNIPNKKCNEKQSLFMQKSIFVQQANSLTPCPYPYQFKRVNHQWYLNYLDVLQPLSQSDFLSFYIDISDNTLLLDVKRQDLIEDDRFFFSIKSKHSGFVSLLNIYENGEIGLLLENSYIVPNFILTFPDIKGDLELKASLLYKAKPTIDLYVLLFSKNKINLSNFNEQQSTLVKNKSYQFATLHQLMKNYRFTTTVIRTQPNSL